MGDTFEDIAEGFTPLGSTSTADAAFIRPAHTFRGKKLFPYSLGAEGIIDEALVGIRGDALFALAFLQVLGDLEDGYQRRRTAGKLEDEATEAAVADLLRTIYADIALYHARANSQRARLGRKGVTEAIKLVNQITKEAKDSELISAEPSNAGGDSAPK